MDETQIFLIAAVMAMAAIAGGALYLRAHGDPVPVSLWKVLAAVLVLAGILVGREVWLGYALAGLGVVVALADTARQRRRLRNEADRSQDSDPL